MITNPKIQSHKFHIASTEAGNGIPLKCDDFDTVGFQFYGTTTSATCIFEGTVSTDPSTTLWNEIPAVKKTETFPIATQTIFTAIPNEIWTANVKGLAQVRVRISAIGNGNLSAIGLGVA